MARLAHGKSREAELLTELGFKFTEEPQFNVKTLIDDISKSQDAKRVQVRDNYDPKERSRKEKIREFVTLMTAGVEFPPIVVTADHWLVDGNTRVFALLSMKNGRPTFPALVLDEKWEGSDPAKSIELEYLAGRLNTGGPQSLSPSERRNLVYRLFRSGWTNESIYEAFGIPRGSCSDIRNELAGAERLVRLGISPNGSGPTAFKAQTRAALGREVVQALNDPPFKELALIAKDAGLRPLEIVALAKEVRSLGSEAEQVARLTQMRVEMGDRIHTQRVTGASKPPESSRLRQVLGNVTKFKGEEAQKLLENNPALVENHILAISDAIAVLQTVLVAQKSRL